MRKKQNHDHIVKKDDRALTGVYNRITWRRKERFSSNQIILTKATRNQTKRP